MAIELVTGYAGAAHISSADDGMFNIGAFGAGKYVLQTANQLAASVVSANSISIAAGDALFEGRHVRLSSAETVAIDNGAQGVNRNDIICIKYEKASGTNIETASLAVIKGTAAATATDPTIPSGSIAAGASTAYMPLYRIPVRGITVNTPVQMFSVLPSVSSAIGETVQISRGGTGATNAANALKNIMGGKAVLFNDATGTSGTVSLSQSAANFDHMKIYYRSTRNTMTAHGSIDVYEPNGKTADLQMMFIDSGYAYHYWKLVTVSGTFITQSSGYGWYGNDASSATTENQNNIYITRVEAWNE